MIKEKIDANTFLNIMSSYKSEELDFEVKAKPELSVDYDPFGAYAHMSLYCEGEIDGEVVKDSITHNDVNIALSKYAEGLNYDLDSYELLFGVKREGLLIKRDVAYFNGAKLKLLERQMVRKLKNEVVEWKYQGNSICQGLSAARATIS